VRIDQPPEPADDLAREGDPVPDEPVLEHPAPVAGDTEPAEPRTRHEHADPPPSPEPTEPPEGSSTPPDQEDVLPDVHDAITGCAPLGDRDRGERIVDVLARLDKADSDGLSSDELHTVDPVREIWSAGRALLHDSIINDVYDQSANVPCEYKAIIAGGLSGAGKTTVLANHPDIDQSQYLSINPDSMKAEMARRGMIPTIEGLSPMEASELVHEESSYLARQLALRAEADGKNIIWDITMSDGAKTEGRITELREAGYTNIEGLFVEISIETSLRRTEARYWADQDKWMAGDGSGGRLIPPDVILRQADREWGTGNRKTFESIKTMVDSWEIRNNSIDGPSAVLVDSYKPKRPEAAVRSTPYE
jgi:predicted ABC-type ATPase